MTYNRLIGTDLVYRAIAISLLSNDYPIIIHVHDLLLEIIKAACTIHRHNIHRYVRALTKLTNSLTVKQILLSTSLNC